MSTHKFINHFKFKPMETYRHNESENIVLQTTIETIPQIKIFKKDNTMGIVEVRNLIFKGTKLFIDAQNPNKTSKGNYRKTEFRIVGNKSDVYVEVKQQKTSSNITDSVLGEISRAKNIKGQYWLILLGKPYQCPIVLYSIAEAIKDFKLTNKVKVMTTIEQYKTELQKVF